MKVGILTFPGSQSYGASLQMMGTYMTIQDLGCQVEVINYVNDYMRNRKHISESGSFIRQKLRRIKFIPKIWRFRKFEKKIVLYPHKAIHNSMQLREICKRYDYVICGSDQVWNPLITGSDYSYFFDFIDDSNKKIGYAPSFGVTKLPNKDVETIQKLLMNFSHISVRESAGQKIINDLIGIECPVVIDPSMLRTKKEWRKQAKEVNGLPTNYIFYFMLNSDEKARRFAENLSEKTGYPIVCVCGIVGKNQFTNKNMYVIGPDEWLYTIDNAKYVITDSFHGSAFSIIFEKDCFISLASKTNSRIITLIETMGMTDRVINEESQMEDFKPINYVEISKRLENKREYGIRFLKHSLGIEV